MNVPGPPEPVESASEEERSQEEAAGTRAAEAVEEVATEASGAEETETEASGAEETETEASLAEETETEAPERVARVEPESRPPPPARGRPPSRETVQTVGRRKEAVARILLRPGKGELRVNGRRFEEYFPLLRQRAAVEKPLKVVDAEGMYDVRVRADGGGLTGQAEAAQLGLARALVEFDEERRAALRAHGLLTRDPRAVERKKPGQPKARKKFQFSKR